MEPRLRSSRFDLVVVCSPVLLRSLTVEGIEYAGMAVAIWWIFIIRRFKSPGQGTAWFGGILVGLTYLSAVLGIDPGYSTRVAHVVALCVGYTIAVSAYFSSRPSHIRLGLGLIYLAGILHALQIAFLGQRSPLRIDPSVGRTALEMVNANQSSWMLAVGLWAGAASLLLWPRGRSRWQAIALLSGLVVIGVQLVATGSRTGIASAILGMVALALYRAPRLVYGSSVISSALAVAISLSPGLMILVARGAVSSPLLVELSAYRGVDGLNGRAELWQFMHNYVRAQPPLLGSGPTSYRLELGESLTAHNFVLEAWSGVGALGLLAYLLFLASLLRTPLRRTGSPVRASMVFSGSAFLLLLPTFMASTQFWVAPTAAVLGLAGTQFHASGVRDKTDFREAPTKHVYGQSNSYVVRRGA